jgi:hypothetical protein
MQVVRDQQLRALGDGQVRRYIEQLDGCSELARVQLELSLIRWRDQYGICRAADVERVVALARWRGPEFDIEPGQDWVQRILADPEVSSVTRRLDRLEAEFERRAEIARHNTRIEDALGVEVSWR